MPTATDTDLATLEPNHAHALRNGWATTAAFLHAQAHLLATAPRMVFAMARLSSASARLITRAMHATCPACLAPLLILIKAVFATLATLA